MEYIKSGLKSVLGAPSPESSPSGAETVERLVDRLTSSTLLSDRRDACRALKALSRTYRVEVGVQGMDALKQILYIDRTDCEIIGLSLDTLYNVTSCELFEEKDDKQELKHNIGEQFTEILIKDQESVSHVLKFLEEFDFRVRWSALKLLSNLLTNKPKDIQEIILESPMGISKLMDMLGDTRDVIRNDALLLLIQLTKGNINIQKIVAFENAFDRIYDVIYQEGGIEGGIVVEDCLLLMVNLLRGNYSNQYFFKEGNYIQRLTPMIQFFISGSNNSDSDSHMMWTPQKISNVHCVMQVIRSLVVPNGSAQSVTDCQKIMKNCNLLQALCDILMTTGIPTDILTETICTVAEIIRGNAINQEFLASVMAPSTPPRPAIVVLLMSMVNEKQPFSLRCAILYCFQCSLFKNETRQQQLIQTLLPLGKESSSLTTGQLLCGGLFASEQLSNWFSAVALSHALIYSADQKEQLLRVLLATNIGTPPITLLQQCVMLLQQGNKIQSKLGLLILLCRWISYSSMAVKDFLSIDSSISYLVALLSSNESNDDLQEILHQSMCAFLIGICVHFNDNSVPDYTKVKICNLIEKRIGLDKFQDIIGGITRHEVYSRCLKHPQHYAKDPSEILLDHEFCRLLKTLEGVILKSVLDYNSSYKSNDQANFFNSSDSTMIVQYKELIREQDIHIENLNKSIEKLSKENQELEHQKYELKCEIDFLTDQTKILKATKINCPEQESLLSSCPNESVNKELEQYKNQIRNLEERLNESQDLIRKYQQTSNDNNEDFNLKQKLQEKNEEIEKLKKDQEDLLELLTDQDNKLEMYKQKLLTLGIKINTDDISDELDTDSHPSPS